MGSTTTVHFVQGRSDAAGYRVAVPVSQVTGHSNGSSAPGICQTVLNTAMELAHVVDTLVSPARRPLNVVCD